MSTIIQASGNDAQEVGVTQATIDDLMPVQSGLLSTARHRVTGGPPAILKDDTLVTLPSGMQITLQHAAREGLVRRDAAGAYHEVQPGSEEAAEDSSKLDAEAQGVPFEPQQEAMLAHLNTQIPPALQTATLEHFITSGNVDAMDMQSAVDAGMDREQFHAGVSAVANAFKAQGFAHFTKQGVDPQAFSDWANQACPGEIKAAMRQHVISRNLRAYDSLLERYMKSSAPSSVELEKAGYKARTDKSGSEMVNIPGVGWTTAKAAARAGLI